MPVSLKTIDSPVELHSLMPMGLLMKKLADQGITDRKQIAELMLKLRCMIRERGFYSWEGYTEQGASAHVKILGGSSPRDCIMWCQNSYLGLGRNERLIRASQQAVERFGTGAGTSAMSGGRCALHAALEQRLTRFLGKEKVILFPTGFTANQGTISALMGERDLILSDAGNHASIIDGCRASAAKLEVFEHNSPAALERALKSNANLYENVLVVIESAYSMSGNLAPLHEIVALRERYGFMLYVDEAHTFGFYGDAGRGYCHELGVSDQVDFLMGTFSKALASVGGFVALSEKYETMLSWMARPYLFQTMIPPPDIAVTLAALDEIEANPAHARKVHENNDYFRFRLRKEGFNLGTSQCPIVPIFIENLEALLKITNDLFEAGIYTVSVTYPAVGIEEGRLRFVCTATHSHEQIDKTVDTLAILCRKHGVWQHDQIDNTVDTMQFAKL